MWAPTSEIESLQNRSKETTADTATPLLSRSFHPPIPLHELRRRVLEHASRRSCDVPHATALPHHTQFDQPPHTLLLLMAFPKENKHRRSLIQSIHCIASESANLRPPPLSLDGPKSPFLSTTSRAC